MEDVVVSGSERHPAMNAAPMNAAPMNAAPMNGAPMTAVLLA